MRRLRTFANAALLAIGLFGASNFLAADRSVLRVYGSIEADELDDWIAAFERDNPGIRLSFVRGSTGILTAKILAEASNPNADVIWRLANTSLIQFSEKGLLEPYAPKYLHEIRKSFKAKHTPPDWVGHIGYMGALCINSTELQRLGISSIKSWSDLLDPRLKGRILMPSPSSSGTGLLHLVSWLSRLGDTAGWSYMSRLHGNIAFYTTSGSKPCALVASGEFPIGLSFSTRGEALKRGGAPIDVIFPQEGVGWDLEGSAIMAGTKNRALAQQFMDWVTGPTAAALYLKRYPLTGFKQLIESPDYERLLVPLDFYAVAAARNSIIKRWEQEFSAKIEK